MEPMSNRVNYLDDVSSPCFKALEFILFTCVSSEKQSFYAIELVVEINSQRCFF